MIGILGVVSAAYAVAAVLRLHAEETERRAEPVLATPVGRVGWAGSHLLVAAGGSAGLLLAGGLATALGDGLTSGGLATQLPRLIGAGLAQIPAAWVMGGLAAALFGLVPRAAVVGAWTALGLVALITLLDPSIRWLRACWTSSQVQPSAEAAGAPVHGGAVGVAGGGGGGAGCGRAGRIPAA